MSIISRRRCNAACLSMAGWPLEPGAAPFIGFFTLTTDRSLISSATVMTLLHESTRTDNECRVFRSMLQHPPGERKRPLWIGLPVDPLNARSQLEARALDCNAGRRKSRVVTTRKIRRLGSHMGYGRAIPSSWRGDV